MQPLPLVETSSGQTAFPVRAWLLLVVVASSVPLLLFACWLAYVDYHRLRDATVSPLSNVSRALIEVLDGQLFAHKDMLRALAESEALQSGDLRKFDERARAYLVALPPGSSILLAIGIFRSRNACGTRDVSPSRCKPTSCWMRSRRPS